MRLFLTRENFRASAILSAGVTLMSLGRLAHGMGSLFVPYVILTFSVMFFVCGAVTAWGRCGGMAGVITDWATFEKGTVLALALAMAILPIQVLWTDPLLRAAVENLHAKIPQTLFYPHTLGGCISLVLWSAGFQTVFLVAAPMAFFARLTGRWPVALGACLALRFFVTSQQLGTAGITMHIGLFHGMALVGAGIGCLLFARYGLVPAMAWGGALDLHTFWGPADG